MGLAAAVDHHILHTTAGIDLDIQRYRQQLPRGGIDIAAERHESTCMRLAPTAQADGIGACTSTADREQALVGGQRRQCFRPVGQQAIADHQVFLHLRLRLPLRQRTGTIGLHRHQRPAQFTPVAAADMETTHLLGTITQHRQRDIALAHRSEVAIQQRELAGAITLASGAGTIPQQPHFRRHAAWRGRRRHRQLCQQVVTVLPACNLHLCLALGR
ncbi:hypothetical protein D3C72_1064800 [compost metagenome]